MNKALNIITLVAVAIVGFFLYRLMMASKEQKKKTDALMAAAVKSGMIKIESAPSKRQENYDEGEQEEKPAQPVKLKKIQRQVVSLFEDGIPKQLGELKKIYIKIYGEIEDTKFNNTLYNLKPSDVVNAEKIDGRNYWGLGEWFDEDGSMFEDYTEKIIKPEE